MCPACHELCMTWPLTTPSALSSALRLAQSFVTDGTLSADAASRPMPPFTEVNPEDPWDDLIEYHFHCRHCGEKFVLHAETYHGGGGSWRVEP